MGVNVYMYVCVGVGVCECLDVGVYGLVFLYEEPCGIAFLAPS